MAERIIHLARLSRPIACSLDRGTVSGLSLRSGVKKLPGRFPNVGNGPVFLIFRQYPAGRYEMRPYG